MKTNYSNWGIANVFPGGDIEINRKLKQPRFLQLHKEIINHERGHKKGDWSWYDFKHDLGWVKNRKLWWKFVLTTPKSWVQFLPLYYSRGRVHLDITLTIFWIIIISLIGGMFWII